MRSTSLQGGSNTLLPSPQPSPIGRGRLITEFIPGTFPFLKGQGKRITSAKSEEKPHPDQTSNVLIERESRQSHHGIDEHHLPENVR